MQTKTAVNTAFLYLSALIGAGFATGRELYQYFFRYGTAAGIAGIFISASLFALTAYKTLIICGKNGICSYGGLLETLFGKGIGKAFYITTCCFFLVLFSAMSASFGEILKSAADIPKPLGNLIFCIFCHAAAKRGKDCADSVNRLLCPVILLGCPLLGLSAAKNIHPTAFSPAVIPSAIIYTSYNLLTSTAVLCGCEKPAKKGSVLASVMIFSAAFVSGTLAGLLSDSPAALPIYENIKHDSAKCVIYMTMLLCAVTTTAIGNLSALPREIPVSAAVFAGYIISLCGFGKIVENFYFVFGLIGCGVLTGLLIHGESRYSAADVPYCKK